MNFTPRDFRWFKVLASFAIIGTTASLAQTPPTITTQPVSQDIAAGGNVRLQVSVGEPDLLQYQWVIKGTNYPKALIYTIVGGGSDPYIPNGSAATNGSFANPTGMAFGPDHRLIFSDPFQATVFQVDTNGIITRFAGTNLQNFSGDGGPATEASLSLPNGIATDSHGNVYITDAQNNRIRKVTPDGVITTVAGGGPISPGDHGPATNALLSYPLGLAIDKSDNLYVAEFDGNRIRKIGSNGIIETIAGNGTSGDGGPAATAALHSPVGVAVSESGIIYIADTYLNAVRKIDSSGIISTIAGNGTASYSGDGGPAALASLNRPNGVAVDNEGNVYVADRNNNAIRRIDANGIITTVAGTGRNGYSGDYGPARGANLATPGGLLVEDSGNLLVAHGNVIRRIALKGLPTLPLPNISPQDQGDYWVIVGNAFGSTTSAVATVTVDAPPQFLSVFTNRTVPVGGNLIFSASISSGIPVTYQWRRNGVPLPGQTDTTLQLQNIQAADQAEYDLVASNAFGNSTSAVVRVDLELPPAITSLPVARRVLAGTTLDFQVSVTNAGPYSYVWRINGSNQLPVITTIAGNGLGSPAIDGMPTLQTGFGTPYDVALDASGNILALDTLNNVIRRVDTDGIMTTFVGNGLSGFAGDGGPAAAASFRGISGMDLDREGNLYIVDSVDNRVRKVGPNGIVSTVAGNGIAGFSGDGGPATEASFLNPTKVIADPSGALFVSDTGNHRIRKIDVDGGVSTIAGDGIAGHSGDGDAATNASLNFPRGIAISQTGEIYIGDSVNDVVRKVDNLGIITTFAGNGTRAYSGDGGPATKASLNHPTGLLFDHSGNLLIADYSNSRVRRVDTNGIITNVAGDGTQSYYGDGGPAVLASMRRPNAMAVDERGNILIADTGTSLIRRVALTGLPTLTIPNAQPGDSGTYEVIVSSPYGTTTGTVAVVNVGYAPVIKTPFHSVGATEGAATTLTVEVIGTPPFSYQWLFNETNAPGVTTSNLTLVHLESSDEGIYSVTVSNDYGTATGEIARLTLGVPPTIGQPPVDQTVYAGGSIHLQTTATGTGPFRYQWQLDGTNIADNIVQTIAGNGKATNTGDGLQATGVALSYPIAVAVDYLGNLFITTSDSHTVRKVTPSGIISTVAGNGERAGTGDGGNATNASLAFPVSLAANSRGELYIGDLERLVIRKVDLNGIISTVAGYGGSSIYQDGLPATNTRVNPWSMVFDPFGNLVIAETTGLRRIDSHGIISTIAGNASPALNPHSVASDAAGNLYIAERYRNLIRKIDLQGAVTIVAGRTNFSKPPDTVHATNVSLVQPMSVAVSPDGTIYIAEGLNSRIRSVDTNGYIHDLSASPQAGFSGDGGPASRAQFDGPNCVALDPAGNLYIVDQHNQRVRKIFTAGRPFLDLSPASLSNAGEYRVTISTPYGDDTSSTATVEVVWPQLSLVGLPGPGYTLNTLGAPEAEYRLQISTNLAQTNGWRVAATNISDEAGHWSVPDPSVPGTPAVFYRLALP